MKNKLATLLGSLAMLLVFTLSSPAICAEYIISAPDTPVAYIGAKLIKALYKKIGHRASVIFLPGSRSLADVNAGKQDGEMARVTEIEIKYTNLLRIPEPISSMSYSAIVHQGSDITRVVWIDLRTRTFARLLGNKLVKARTRNFGGVAVSSPEAIVKMVASNHVQVGLLRTSDAIRITRLIQGVKILTPPLEVVPLYHYVHAKNRHLIFALTEALRELNDSGQSALILQQE